MARILITGGSRGVGAAFSEGVPEKEDEVWLVSRSRPGTLDLDDGVVRRWIQADLSDPAAIESILAEIGDRPLDVLICNAGIWESTAFSDRYDFEALDRSENWRVIQINLISLIDTVQGLLPNLKGGTEGKLILIGSTNGMENIGDPEVAYNASKFGVRGVTEGLREVLRPAGIPVTVINPGSIATQYPLGSSESLEIQGTRGIPLIDLVKTVRYLLSLSNQSCVKRIDIPAMRDTHA